MKRCCYILTNVLVVVLYLITAICISNAIFTQALVYDQRSTAAIVVITVISLVLLVSHYLILYCGRKKNQIHTASVILLCFVDLLAFGFLFFLYSLTALFRGVIIFVISLAWDSHLYRLIFTFLGLRTITTIRFFTSRGSSSVSRNE